MVETEWLCRLGWGGLDIVVVPVSGLTGVGGLG